MWIISVVGPKLNKLNQEFKGLFHHQPPLRVNNHLIQTVVISDSSSLHYIWLRINSVHSKVRQRRPKITGIHRLKSVGERRTHFQNLGKAQRNGGRSQSWSQRCQNFVDAFLFCNFWIFPPLQKMPSRNCVGNLYYVKSSSACSARIDSRRKIIFGAKNKKSKI